MVLEKSTKEENSVHLVTTLLYSQYRLILINSTALQCFPSRTKAATEKDLCRPWYCARIHSRITLYRQVCLVSAITIALQRLYPGLPLAAAGANVRQHIVQGPSASKRCATSLFLSPFGRHVMYFADLAGSTMNSCRDFGRHRGTVSQTSVSHGPQSHATYVFNRWQSRLCYPRLGNASSVGSCFRELYDISMYINAEKKNGKWTDAARTCRCIPRHV